MGKSAIKNELEKLNASALLGIDGMIDEVWELLKSRTSDSEYTKMTNLMDFGSAIVERKTGGMATERILKRKISGGFVCNTGRAVASLGLDTTFLCTFGKTQIDSIFDEFKDKVEIFSCSEPAYINLLEFTDGKIMMPNLESIINLKWADIEKMFTHEQLKKMTDKDIIGFGYWSNMYDFEKMLSNIINLSKESGKAKRVFHDFANLNKRTKQALLEALQTLKEQNEILPQTLSLNEHEGGILCKALGISYPEDVNTPKALNDVLNAAQKVQEMIEIDEVVIHTLYFAVSATKTNGSAYSMQNYCENPVKTAGAGDTFNGGYMMSSLTNLSQEDKLAVANATTYLYVSTGNAPSKSEVLAQIDKCLP